MDKLKSMNLAVKKLGILRVADEAGLNKSTVSRYVNGERDYSFENFHKVLSAVNRLEEKLLRGRTSARDATQRVFLGEDWKIAYFDFVDSFLATQSPRLIEKRPVEGLNVRLLALMCSIVMQLCEENKVEAPDWAKLSVQLEAPWFVSKFKKLRAYSLVESPLYFRRNNIFVGSDFLKRV